MRQLAANPWDSLHEKFPVGMTVEGRVRNLTDFGAFIEIEDGIDGLVHVSNLSWTKRVKHPSEVLKKGDRVKAVILAIEPDKRRLSLGVKQLQPDVWESFFQTHHVGDVVHGKVLRVAAFGAFVEIAEGVEGLVHISEITVGRRLNHPSDMLRVGQRVQALVLAIDAEKRQIKLSMKQLIPTGLDEYIAEHKVGDAVSGRVVIISPTSIDVELGEGIRGTCRASGAPAANTASAATAPAAKADLSQLSSMLKARWKGSAPAAAAKPEPLAEGQVRSFKIVKLDAESKKIEVELA
jgi:small subunit ribosomal protein S1